jgi:hypothetical protein
MNNTGGNYIVAGENSTGNNLITGDSAYDMCIRGPSGISFSANAGATQHMRLTSTGILNTSNNIAVTGDKNVSVAAYGITGFINFRGFYNNDYIDVVPNTNGVRLASGGTSWSGISDETLKTDLKPIENALAKAATVRGVTGRYKTDEVTVSRAFLIAQDVEKVLPEAVSRNAAADEAMPEDKRDPWAGKLMLQHTDTLALVFAALGEISARLEALEAK